MVDSTMTEVTEHFDVDHAFIARLNEECHEWAGLDGEALDRALRAQGKDWYSLVKERCPHLFAAAPVYVSEVQLQQMRAVIAAVEEVAGGPEPNAALGVFYGYDFHLNEQGAHLIEINSNAGGGFLNALLIDSQRDSTLYGEAIGEENLEQVFIEMFRNEWRLVRGDAPLKTVAIMDEQPESQYLYPEFLLAQKMFERAGIAAHVLDPHALQSRDDGLYYRDERVDLIYNRLTDFNLQQHPQLRSAWEKRQVVLTPDPVHYYRYSDKRRLVQLTDAAWLRGEGVSERNIETLLRGIPQTKAVRAENAGQWWEERKQWFFKPASGYGSKGAYRGENVTKRVFEEIMRSDYVAQRLALPDKRKVCTAGAESQALKFDVRCFAYAGNIQLVAARLYQGQTTNFRTLGGGFALVREVR